MTRAYGSLRPHRRFWVALALIALFGLLQASATLDWSLRTDEPFTANAVHQTWSGMWAVFETDNVAPLHYVLLWGWVRLFGESEIALRLPSLIFFGAMIFVVGRTAQRAAGSRAGLMAALLLTISTNMGLVHAAIARPYALLGLLIAVAIYATLITLSVYSPSQVFATASGPAAPPAHPIRWHILLVGLHTLGLLTHPLYVFVLVALILGAGWISRRAFSWLAVGGLAAISLFLILNGPLLLRTIFLPTIVWMPVPTLSDLGDGFLNLWGEQKTQAIGLYLLVLAGIGLWRGQKTRAVLADPVIRLGLTGLLVTSLAPFVVSQVKPIYIATRAPVIFLPFACLVTAISLRRLDHRLTSLVVFAALAASATSSSYQILIMTERVPVRASMQTIVARVTCDDVLIMGGLSLSSAEYYFRRFNAPACLQIETFPLDTATHPGWLDGPGLLSRIESLRAEARQTAQRVSNIPGRVWLFYDSRFYPEVGDLIKSELGQQLVLVETLDLRGSFFDFVLIHAPSR